MSARIYNSESLPEGLYQVISINLERRLFTLVKKNRVKPNNTSSDDKIFIFQAISQTKPNKDEFRHTFIRVYDYLDVIEVSGDRQIRHDINKKYETSTTTTTTLLLPKKSTFSKLKKPKAKKT